MFKLYYSTNKWMKRNQNQCVLNMQLQPKDKPKKKKKKLTQYFKQGDVSNA